MTLTLATTGPEGQSPSQAPPQAPSRSRPQNGSRVQVRPRPKDGTATTTEADTGADPWFTVCDLSTLSPGRGVAALLPDGRQVAVFLDRRGSLHAVDNRDPFTGAAVLSRGLTGTHRGRPYVASPLLKQRFDLESGRCLDEDGVRVATYEVRSS